MRKHKNKIIAGIVIAILLAFVFWYGGDAPGLRGWTPEPKETASVRSMIGSLITDALVISLKQVTELNGYIPAT